MKSQFTKSQLSEIALMIINRDDHFLEQIAKAIISNTADMYVELSQDDGYFEGPITNEHIDDYVVDCVIPELANFATELSEKLTQVEYTLSTSVSFKD